MNVGENIKRIRLAKGLTQKQLGELSGINAAQIRRYELGGHNSSPKYETLVKIANALEVDISELNNDYSVVKQDFIQSSPILRAYESMEGGLSNPTAKMYLWSHLIGDMDMTDDKIEMIYNYNKLNNVGQQEAKKRIAELTKIPEYQKSPSPERQTLNAAHDEGATEEQKANADRIMNDDSEWQ